MPAIGALPVLLLGAWPGTVARADPSNGVEPAWVWASEVTSPVVVDPATLSTERPICSARAVRARRACGPWRCGWSNASCATCRIWTPTAWPAPSASPASHTCGRAPGSCRGAHSTTQRRARNSARGRRRSTTLASDAAASRSAAEWTAPRSIAAVALDAQADLSPFPIRTHVGVWLPVEVEAPRARRGGAGRRHGADWTSRAPYRRSWPASRVRAQLALDQPGAFRCRSIADIATGPRPVLEAELFADAAPWTQMPDLAAPGETATPLDATDRGALLAMIQVLRKNEHLPAFTPDPRLDAVAIAHARRMLQARGIGHDVGDGDPARRLEAVNVRARSWARTSPMPRRSALAHRALYASPSHRSNLLSTTFDRVGVGIMRDPGRERLGHRGVRGWRTVATPTHDPIRIRGRCSSGRPWPWAAGRPGCWRAAAAALELEPEPARRPPPP